MLLRAAPGTRLELFDEFRLSGHLVVRYSMWIRLPPGPNGNELTESRRLQLLQTAEVPVRVGGAQAASPRCVDVRPPSKAPGRSARRTCAGDGRHSG